MNRHLCSVLVASGVAAAAAQAQTNWETQVQFRNRVGGFDSAPLAGNTLALTATGTYTFTVQVGIFNVTGFGVGQSNYGLVQWTSALTSAGLAVGDALAVTPTNARVSPFVFGPATSFAGTVTGGGAGINNVNCQRDVSGGATAPGPQPTLPSNASPGANTHVSVWRFTVNVTSITGPNIVINFAGQAGPVVQWATFIPSPPIDEGAPGSVSFLGLTPTPVLRTYTAASLTLIRPCASSVTITSQPAPQSINVGAPVFFAAAAATTSGSPTYQWKRNGVNLANFGRVTGVNERVLMISPSVIGDAGQYAVTITDACANATSSAATLGLFCPTDVDRNGASQPADVGAFIANWFSALNSGGC